MTDPITPPHELVQEWGHDANLSGVPYDDETGHWAYEQHIATRAARWGADQELEACCEWFADDVVSEVVSIVAELRAARRPKPLSLKERALQAWAAVETGTDDQTAMAVIRRALEELPDN
jgi:hypothetical protein